MIPSRQAARDDLFKSLKNTIIQYGPQTIQHLGYHLEQMIKDHTRIATTTTETGEQKTSKTLIDHFSTSCPKYILKADVIKTGMVDHYLVYAIRKINAWRLKKKERKFVESRSMKKYEKTLFRVDMQQIDWESILGPFEGDPAGMAATF